MTDAAVSFRLYLLKEQISVLWEVLLLKLHLKEISVEDWHHLKMRMERIRTQVKVANDDL